MGDFLLHQFPGKDKPLNLRSLEGIELMAEDGLKPSYVLVYGIHGGPPGSSSYNHSPQILGK